MSTWYADGLRFECTQCGECCTGFPGYVWITPEELTAVAEHLGDAVGAVRLMHTKTVRGRISLRDFANGDCTFFDPQTRRCRIYAVRPRQCQTWPFWPVNLSTPETWERVQTVCPGAGQGNLVPLEVIQQNCCGSPGDDPHSKSVPPPPPDSPV